MGTWYRTGTLTATNGSATVTGTTTGWLSTVRAGDFLLIGSNPPVEIGSVDSNTQLTLVQNWPYTTATGSAYAIAQGIAWGDVTTLAVEIANLIQSQIELLSGTGVPSNSIGSDGSYYFRQDSPEYYVKASGSWGSAISLGGPTGATGADYTTTSTTSNTVASSGSKTFIVSSSKAFVAGTRVRAASSVSPTNYMEGVVTSYSGTTLIFTADNSAGSGTFASWNISLAGDKGSTGATGASYAGTSTTSLAIGTGSKSLTTQSGLAYVVGSRTRVASSASPSNYMEGVVTSYSGSSMTVNVDRTGGSGTLASWNISLAGDVGSQGVQGVQGAQGVQGVAGASYSDTSTTSNTIEAGTKTWTVSSGKPFVVGLRLRLSDASNSANVVEGEVTSYASTTLQVAVDYTEGSGTITSWTIGVAGARGATGPTGATGATGPEGPTYNSTSTTSIAAGTGSKAFTVAAGLPYSVGQRLRVVSAGDVDNWMSGIVTDYTSTTLTIDVDLVGSAPATASDWNISLTGEKGDTGPSGGLTGLSQTKGNIPVADGTTYTPLAVGANGQVPIADSAQTVGIKWDAPDNGVCEGRLSLTSGTPVTVSDVTAATTVYFTPYKGNRVALYNGTSWQMYTFTERSLSLSGLSANTNYDIFLYDNAGTLTLEAVAWTNATTRATVLALQDGVNCKSGTLTRRYLGTIRITGTTGQCEDSKTKRFVWNMYNRAPRHLERLEDTNTWNYSTATWRQANGSALNQFEMVRGLNEDPVQATVLTVATNSTATQRTVRAGLGLDSTTIPTGTKSASVITNTLFYFGPAGYVGAPGLGYHYLAWLEQGAGADTQTWYGDNGGSDFQAGMQGLCWS